MFRDRAIVLLALGQTLIWAATFYIFPAMILRWEAHFDWSRGELTTALTVSIIMTAVASPLAGRLIDRGVGPEMMAISAVVGGLFLAILPFLTSFWQFFVVWAVIGFANGGCLYEPCFAIVTRIRGAQARADITKITLIAGFASTLSFPLSHVISETYGWQMAILFWVLTALFVATPLLYVGGRLLGPGQVEQRRKVEASTRRHQHLRLDYFWMLALGFALLAVVHGAVLQHLLPIVVERGISLEIAVLAASFIGPMQVLGRLVITMMGERIRTHHIALGAFGLIGLSCLLLMYASHAALLLAGFVFCFGAAYGTVSIIRPVLARDLLGDAHFGAKAGVLALLYLSGSAFGPMFASWLWTIGTYDLVLKVTTGLAVTGLCLYLLAQSRAEAQQSRV